MLESGSRESRTAATDVRFDVVGRQRPETLGRVS
jgi:hypothetical protein